MNHVHGVSTSFKHCKCTGCSDFPYKQAKMPLFYIMIHVSIIIEPSVYDGDNNTVCQHCLSTNCTTKETFASLNYNNSVVEAQTGRGEKWTQAMIMAGLFSLRYKSNFQEKFDSQLPIYTYCCIHILNRIQFLTCASFSPNTATNCSANTPIFNAIMAKHLLLQLSPLQSKPRNTGSLSYSEQLRWLRM